MTEVNDAASRGQVGAIKSLEGKPYERTDATLDTSAQMPNTCKSHQEGDTCMYVCIYIYIYIYIRLVNVIEAS